MRFTCAIACGLVAWSCVENANGASNLIFDKEALWIWNVIAALWAWSGVHVLFRGAP